MTVLPTRKRRAPEQLAFDLRRERRGGVRKGAGRKPRAERKGMEGHGRRPAHKATTPVHAVARVVRGVPDLRSQRVFHALRAILSRISEKGFRLLQFSVQGNHLHLIVEADTGAALARGMQRLLSRVALVVNRIGMRMGRVFRDRYTRIDLTRPKQVRYALVYVMFNVRKHDRWTDWGTILDDCSSAPWFRGFAAEPPPWGPAAMGASPVVPAQSWLARVGWLTRGGGAIRADEIPRS